MTTPRIIIDLQATLKAASYTPAIHIDIGDTLEDDVRRLCCLREDQMKQLIESGLNPEDGVTPAGQKLTQLMVTKLLDQIIHEHVIADLSS